MKLVLIVGSGAVGKMTVGQALMEKTGLRLFHNHMMIEPVIQIFGSYNGKLVSRLRQVIFEEFARSDLEGMIFTCIWAFDQPSDWAYMEMVTDLFRQQGGEIYCVELIAPLEVRLERNKTENRLAEKASKRDVEFSQSRLLLEEETYRMVSREGEIPFRHYLRLDNTDLTPEQAAEIICRTFDL